MITARERNIGKAERCANPNGCMSSENRCDLFQYVRWLLYITAIRPIPFEEFLPTRFHRYSVLLNLILDIFLDLMLLHMLVLFLCTIYFNYDNGDLEFLISVGIQALLYFWVTFVKFIFRRVYPDLTNGILDYVNEEYIAHSAVELRDKVRMPNEEINEYYVTDELPFDLDCLPHVLNPADTARPRSFREAFNYALRPCVEHHIFILDVLHKVDRLFNFMWLVKTFEVTLFFCMAAFNIAKLSEGKTFLKLFCIGHYLLLGLSELFMICYASEIIYIGSQRCGEALLRSPWHLHLREVRTDYLLFLTSAQKTFEFTAGKLYPLRLEKFRGVSSLFLTQSIATYYFKCI
ncbi:odorant receptor 83a-like isoform X2 [Bactrocera dorsalis]|uniref:Odorant receptor n=1 Tax=Bactrocera dorsalis TaxID=27457 RepID=A0ABM3JB85_BACDO|nr:odorant receptor 83a-like isoform X2 [Bactrocera dorsalis]